MILYAAIRFYGWLYGTGMPDHDVGLIAMLGAILDALLVIVGAINIVAARRKP